MGVIHISDEAALRREFSKVPSDRLVIIDFTATWCGPCKMISPVFDDLSKKYLGVSFLKVDVDECSEIAMKYNVSAMPTFVFFKNNGKEVDRLKGADPAGLETKVTSLGGPNATQGSGFAGSGQKLGSGSSNDSSAQGGGSNQNHHSANIEEAAKVTLAVDPNLPTTKIQIRLADGSKLAIQVNLSTHVSKIREFICLVRPDFATKEFSLNSTVNFPVKEITDESISVDEAGLASSVLVQKPKV